MRPLRALTPNSRETFVSNIDTSGACWLWRGTVHGNGYGQFGTSDGVVWAHRLSHELFVGRIPKGQTIDHLCQNKLCVRPSHLDIVSRRENALRYWRDRGSRLCGRGHVLSEKPNRPNGAHECVRCKRTISFRRYGLSSRVRRYHAEAS